MEKIIEKLNIEKLTPMQTDAINAFCTGRDVVLLSPTGSGKTLACLLPLVSYGLEKDCEGVQALVLVPSRELALQSEQVMKSMGTRWKCMSCYGGRPAMEEHRTMKGLMPSVVFGTPGRLNDHLSKNNIDGSTVRILIIDEFDKCLELGFQEEMESVITQLTDIRQRFLLSATDAELIPKFTGMGNTVKLNYINEPHDNIHLYKVMSPYKDKLQTLYALLSSLGCQQSLVFCNHRESVDRVGKYLRQMKVSCEVYHGGMIQDDRERALYKFRNGSSLVLVSTDLAARGLDISGVRNIVHYHLPLDEESFVHRNGRTARWEAEGNAFTIIGPEETLPEYIPADIVDFKLLDNKPLVLKPEFVTLYIGKGKKDKLSKADIMGFLCKKGGLNREQIGRIDVKDSCCYVAVSRKMFRQVLMRIQGEKIKGVKTLFELAK